MKNFTAASVDFSSPKTLTLTAGLLLGVYILGVTLLGLISGGTFPEVNLFSQDTVSPWAVSISFMVFGAGFIMLFVLPGWLIALHFKKLRRDIPVFLGAAFLFSIFIGIAGTTLYKLLCPAGLNRINFLGVLIAILITGLVSLWKQARLRSYPGENLRLSLSSAAPYTVLILAAALFLLTFGHEIIDGSPVMFRYDENTILSIPLGQQSDTLEAFGLAHSLKTHLLPYWDLEYADRFGFVFTDTPLYPYVALFSVLLFGESLAALSLVSIGFVVLMFGAIMAQCRPGSRSRLPVSAGLLLAYLFFLLKEPVVFVFLEHFFLLQVLLAYIFLLRQNGRAFLAFAATATLTRFYGIFFIFLGLGALWLFFHDRKGEARSLFCRYGIVVLCLAGLILLAGRVTGDTATYVKCILIEHFNRLDYFAALSRAYPQEVVYRPDPAVNQSVQFLVWTLSGTALTFPALFVFSPDRKERFYSFIGLVYFFLVFISTYSLPRYVLPLIPLTALVISSQWERYLENQKGRVAPR